MGGLRCHGRNITYNGFGDERYALGLVLQKTHHTVAAGHCVSQAQGEKHLINVMMRLNQIGLTVETHAQHMDLDKFDF